MHRRRCLSSLLRGSVAPASTLVVVVVSDSDPRPPWIQFHLLTSCAVCVLLEDQTDHRVRFFQPHRCLLPAYLPNTPRYISKGRHESAGLQRSRATLHSASCSAWLPPMDASQGSSSAIFPMPQIPALLLPPPPPPATAMPSSSLSLSSYSSSSLRGHGPSSITSFPILLLTVFGILAASVLLLAYYVFVIRCCLTWHRGSSDVADLIVSRRGRRPQRTTVSATTTAHADADPRGLEDAAIRALPAFSYRKKPANAAESPSPSAPASECSVCLGELEEGDRVRMLPACLHVFHLACVDAWLQGNATCPLCRASADVAATLCRLPPLPPPDEEEEVVVVTIQATVVPGGAGEDGQDALAQHRDQATAAPAAEFQGEDTCTGRHFVGGEKTKSIIDACHGMTERTTDGEVLPPPRTRRSFSMDGDAMAAGEVHLQIQSILQRDSHPRSDDHDSDSGRV